MRNFSKATSFPSRVEKKNARKTHKNAKKNSRQKHIKISVFVAPYELPHQKKEWKYVILCGTRGHGYLACTRLALEYGGMAGGVNGTPFSAPVPGMGAGLPATLLLSTDEEEEEEKEDVGEVIRGLELELSRGQAGIFKPPPRPPGHSHPPHPPTESHVNMVPKMKPVNQ